MARARFFIIGVSSKMRRTSDHIAMLDADYGEHATEPLYKWLHHCQSPGDNDLMSPKQQVNLLGHLHAYQNVLQQRAISCCSGLWS